LLKWYGDELKKKTDRVVPWAMMSILTECVREAKKIVPRKTATLQGSIQMRAPRKIAGQWVGLWGSWNCKYALFVELGTAPHMIFPRNKKALYWEGAAHPVARVHHPGTVAKPFLRPTADRVYPQLKGKIGDGMRQLS